MKTVHPKWMESLDEGDIQEAADEACVDAYDEHEQFSGLMTMAIESLEFPFRAKVLGEPVEVVDAACSKNDSLGLDLIVVHKGKQYAIAAQSVELLAPLPEGHLHLAAYLDWKSKF